MADYEIEARNLHRAGKNCATAVYEVLAPMNRNRTTPPIPRSEGGRCGTVLAAEQYIREMGGSTEMIEEFEKQFIAKFGSLQCAELRGLLRNKCNDYVGTAAAMAAEIHFPEQV